jgi:predicted AlkP superfamily phosphohydrolase/phosphomutase
LGTDAPRKLAYSLDWEKTKAYGFSPSSNGIFINVKGRRGQEGIPREEYESFRQKMREELLAFQDPLSGAPVITDIYTREEIFSGIRVHDAPDLTLRLRDNGFISIVESGKLVESRREPLGTHHPDGIFIARGPGIKKGAVLPPLSIIDVTPVLLYSLGLPIPEDLEGRVPIEAFEPELAKSRPVCFGQKTIPPDPFPEALAEEEQEEQSHILSQLKILGYMD